MRAGHRGGLRVPGFSIQPADTLWWSLWEYPGNPYKGSKAIRNRAFTTVAVDMIMLDKLHESGKHWVNNARRSDFLGGSLIWMGYVYNGVKDDLPAPVQAAYETGLGKFVDRLTEWGPTGITDNMDMKTNVGLAYIAEALEQGPVVEKARAYIARNLKLVHPSGMIRDAGGLESSYNGIALHNVTWAAAVAKQWPELRKTLDEMSLLKNHLSLPEPDGQNSFGPSHFNTRTGHGSPYDQWSSDHRDMTAAMLSDHALYLMYGGKRGRSRGWASPERAPMLAQVDRGIKHINTELVPSESRFAPWVAGWWPGRINYAYDNYSPGFYNRLRELGQKNDPLTNSLWLRPETRFIRAFPEASGETVPEKDQHAFLISKQSDHGAILYSGPLGNTKYMNFAGGSLSAFWTPEGGSIILGRNGNPVKPDETKVGWADWRLWPTHALSGLTADGKVFTSARLRRRVSKVTRETGADSAAITFTGPIGATADGGRTVQDNALPGPLTYQRRMELNREGVRIQTSLAGGDQQAVELYETIPLFLREMRGQKEVPHSVEFCAGGECAPATAKPRAGVTEVRIKRFQGGASILFDNPQTVRMAPETWTDSYQSRAQTHNLLIDLLKSDGKPARLGDVAIAYQIRSLPQ